MRGWLVLALLIAACGRPTEDVYSQNVAFDSIVIDEDSISVDPTEIEIVGDVGVASSTTYKIVGAGTSTGLTSFQWVNDTMNVFDATDPTCPAGICPYGMPGIPLPKTGTLSCVPTATPRTATFTVTSNTGLQSSATVTCRSTAVGPSFSVPGIVGRVTTPVGVPKPATLTVTNAGSSALMISATLGSNNASHWKVLDCVATPCPLAVGDTLVIDLSFEPTEHGDLDSSIEISGPPAVGTQSVMLLGTGAGGKLRVDDPPAPEFSLDFGTIAKNQMVTLPVKMSNIGNAGLEVAPSNPGAPFIVAGARVPIAGGDQGQFGVTCMSSTAMPQQVKTVELNPDSYASNTTSVEVKCAIANTVVQVTSPLDFGELRVGAPAGALPITIANPAGSPAVMINRVELVNASGFPALTLDEPALPMMLAGGAQLTANLALDTAADVDLVDVSLEVEIVEADTVTLSQPVTGKVGTPAAVVLPMQLELGTVCVGTPVDGEITMSNTGTVTLAMQRPTMSSESFVPLYTNPTDYPDGGAPLLPGDKATVGVMLAASSAGAQQGTLAWDVDAPGAPFQTTVSVMLIEEGTAVSPGSLRFNSVDIEEPPLMTQTITLENCGPETALVSYDRVRATEGTASAWKLDPVQQQRELLPDETMRVRVAFDPDKPGRHLAELHFGIDSGEQIVTLDGDATGVLPEPTSFYACGCSGSSDPTRGWPIMLAIPFVLRRRRT